MTLPTSLSIATEVRRSCELKPYIASLREHGFEMGVGVPGIYNAHAHRGFTDVAFAPGGLRIHTPEGPLDGHYHFTSPGHWFGPIEFFSNFWFLKFFESEENVCAVPDKLNELTDDLRRGCFVARTCDLKTGIASPRGTGTVGFVGSPDRLSVIGLPGISRINVVE